MKKILLSLLLLIVCTSVYAATYTQTAAQISPGTFPDGTYALPDTLLVGATSTSYDASLYAENNDKSYALYAMSDSVSNPAIIGVGQGKGVTGMTISTSTSNAGVYGIGSIGASGVYGYNPAGGTGVKAYSTAYGVYVTGPPSYGVYVPSATTYGGKFTGDIAGVHATGTTYGVYASSTSGYSLYGSGKARVTGALTVGSCTGCDIAEHFTGDDLEAGDVVVLDNSAVRGVRKTATPYDKLAAGIVSTDPTITMGLKEGIPIALSGVVPTKVVGKISVGDLLTTSSTEGYAMACDDYSTCAGAIIGKAMESQEGGMGKITALVMLG